MSQTSSTSSPTGYVLSPLIFFLPTNSSTSSYQSVNLMKLTDDTTSIGLITDKSAYSGDIENLFYSMLNFSLKVSVVSSVFPVLSFSYCVKICHMSAFPRLVMILTSCFILIDTRLFLEFSFTSPPV